MNFADIKGITLHKSATKASINAVEANLKVSFPADYRSLLENTDGLELDSGVNLFPVDDILERNETYEISEYCEGFILIGGDGGGRGFLIDLKTSASKIYISDLGVLDPSEFLPIAESLQEWVEKKFSITDLPDPQVLYSEQQIRMNKSRVIRREADKAWSEKDYDNYVRWMNKISDGVSDLEKKKIKFAKKKIGQV